MASNQEKIFEKYDKISEGLRAVGSRASGLEFHYTKKLAARYIGPDSAVIELGCATGYYGLYFADKCREYHGIDLYPPHIEAFRRRIAERGLQNVRASVGDATHLPELSDGAFDVVMVLGPLYHLPPAERELALNESIRLCRPGGTLLYAYISPYGAYVKACLTEEWQGLYPSREANDAALGRRVDDVNPDLFFYMTPEEIESRAAAHGLEILQNAGVDFTFHEKRLNEMPEEQFAAWRELCDAMCETPSCTGLSNHGLLICRKPE